MELLEGETLRARLGRGGLPIRKILQIGADLADGLAAAHEKGIVHRDLKPENVFLTVDGRVKILDFGLARQAANTFSDKTDDALTTLRATDPGTVLGTVGYMAPEQVTGQAADARADIFALGCLLYEMASGHRAFARATAAETMTAILREEPSLPPDSALRPTTFDSVVHRCLEKSPTERFQSARDLAFALRSIGESTSSGERRLTGGQVRAPVRWWRSRAATMFGFSAPGFPGSQYVPVVFGTAVYLYGGSVFVKGAVQELRDRLPGMMTLIALAITVAFVFSLAVTLGYPGEALWWELASLTTIMILGHWIEMRSISQASGALRELARLLPSTAQRLIGEAIEDVAISALRDGDIVLVRPGASVPADGIVQSGNSDVNESMITGESVPVSKVEGANVIAGTVNGSGSLRVTVTGTGERTALANIMPGIRYLSRPSTIVAPVGIRSRPLRAIAVIRSPSTMTVTTRGRAPVPSMSVTFVTAIAFDWAVETIVAQAVARDTTISSRANPGAIRMRTAGVRFTTLLTVSIGRTFQVRATGAWDSNSVEIRTWLVSAA